MRYLLLHQKYFVTWLVPLICLILVQIPQVYADDDDYEPCPPCTEWDQSDQDCVPIPGAPCVILDWFGEARDDGDCNQDITYNTRGVPICGSKTKTVRYQEHKTYCPGYYTYEHDSRDVTYTRIITTCRPSYVGPSIVDDLQNAGALTSSCLSVLIQLSEALRGLGDFPDASSSAGCLDSLASYYGYDVADYYSGCEVADISYQGAVFKCTLLGEGCGE